MIKCIYIHSSSGELQAATICLTKMYAYMYTYTCILSIYIYTYHSHYIIHYCQIDSSTHPCHPQLAYVPATEMPLSDKSSSSSSRTGARWRCSLSASWGVVVSRGLLVVYVISYDIGFLSNQKMEYSWDLKGFELFEQWLVHD